MTGGYQILDLRGIDLVIASEAQSITNPFVLKQLLMFRDHIDKAYNFSKPLVNQLKPVLVRFRDKKSGEKTEGATFGELSVDGNYYTFKVTARISGALVLTIVVAFEEITNDYGNKEWVIDTATILLKDESKTITGDLSLTGDLSVGDDASIGGDLTVTGDINGSDIDMSGKIEGAEIVEKMNGYSFTPSEDTRQELVYVGVVKTGNKITFVAFGNYTSDGTDNTLDIGYFSIPASVNAKLVPYIISGAEYLSQSKLHIFDNADRTSLGNGVNAEMVKIEGNKIYMTLRNLNQASLTSGHSYNFRYEQTFLLSDNLIPQE